MKWRDATDELLATVEVAGEPRPVSGRFPDELSPVRIVPGAGLFAYSPDRTASEELMLGARDRADLEAALDRVPFRLITRERVSADRVVVRVFPLSARTSLPTDLDIAVTEVSSEAVAGWCGSNDAALVRDWLVENFIVEADHQGVALIHPGRADQRATFEIVGRSGLRLRVVSTGDGRLRADRVRTRSGQARPPVALIETPVRIVDGTSGSRLDPAAEAMVRSRLSGDDSYLGLWRTYLDLDVRLVLDRARRVGAADYTSRDLMGDRVTFQLERGADFCRNVRVGDSIGASDLDTPLPEHLRDTTATEIARGRGWYGRVTDVDPAHGLVMVAPAREDTAPPEIGTVVLSLAGDKARTDRQREAWAALADGQTLMDHLPQLLAGANPALPDVRVRNELPRAARRTFKQDPTSMQTQAVLAVINTPDILLVQGPPGTGKTTVVVAAEAALAELEGKGTVRRGRTLLSGFQHVAVENLAERTARHDLPPLKLGSGEWSDNALLDWARERVDRLDEWLEANPAESRTAAVLTARLQGVLRDPLAPDALADLLRDAGDMLLGIADSELLSDLASAEIRARSSNESEPGARDDAVAAAWALPATTEQWADGGRRAFRRLTGQLRLASVALSSEAAARLAQAAAHRSTAPPDGIDLARLRLDVLKELRPPRRALLGDVVDPQTWGVLQRAISTANGRARARDRAPADVVAEFRDALALDLEAVRESVARYSPSVAATLQQSVGRQSQAFYEDGVRFHTVIIDEAARANPLDLLIPIVRTERRIVLVGDHRQLPQIVEPEVLDRMEAEGLLSAVDAFPKVSLFERLVELFRKKHDAGGPLRVVRLDKQFRMHPTLGRFVSATFYEPHNEGFESPRPAEEFVHGVDEWSGRCAAWLDVPLSKGAEQSAGTSRRRPAEVSALCKSLGQAMLDSPDKSFGVITFYSAQRDAILTELERIGVGARSAENGSFDVHPKYQGSAGVSERLRIGTVDAFQGREFDVVYLSIVRSNDCPFRGERDATAKYGHLGLENRMCVALSRQSNLLVAVGDRAMFEYDGLDVGLDALRRFGQLADAGGRP